MRVDRLVLTLTQVEKSSVLIVGATVFPTIHVARHALISWHLDRMIPLAADDHEHILQIFCQN